MVTTISTYKHQNSAEALGSGWSGIARLAEVFSGGTDGFCQVMVDSG